MSEIEGDVVTDEPASELAGQEVGIPEVEEVSSARLVATLGLAGIMAGLLLVVVFKATEPTILKNKAAALEAAIQEVLKAPARSEKLYVVDGRLSPEIPEGVREIDADKVYLGFDAEDKPIGFAMAAGEPGFQDIVRLIFGYDPKTRTVLGMKVLESKETPGLGDKIEKDVAWVDQFKGVLTPIEPVKDGKKGGGNPAELETITGATISTKAVVRIINNRLERVAPVLEAYEIPEGTP